MESSDSGVFKETCCRPDPESLSFTWRLSLDNFCLQPSSDTNDHHCQRQDGFFSQFCTSTKQRKVSEYYKKQEKLLEGFNEIETMTETGCWPGSLTEDELKQLARSERMAIHVSNIANSGIIVFASVMATLGLQILLEFIRALVTVSQPDMDSEKEKWMIGIMTSVTAVKFFLMIYCRRFKNEIVRAYAQDHLFDVITNSVGLVTAVLAIALYTMSTWARTVIENVFSLIGRTAPPDFLTKLTYLIWNHHVEIKHIDTVRAYTFGAHYFVEVDIVLPEDMLLHKAHNIGETPQEKLEQLPEVERAFVHIDFEFSHRPEH
ncbi:hypothetical protein QYF36_005384 [Acer negundo]|nr:hypothetical protein QYF36_005384 [Acer negundo]